MTVFGGTRESIGRPCRTLSPHLRRTGVDRMAPAQTDPQSGDRRRSRSLVARALHRYELQEPCELPYVPPPFQARHLVPSDDPEKVIRRVQPPKVPRCVDRIAHSPPGDLVVRQLEPRLALYRRPDHRQAVHRQALRPLLSGARAAGTKTMRSSPCCSPASRAAMRWPLWTGSKLPPRNPIFTDGPTCVGPADRARPK